MDLLNAFIALLNYVVIPATTYGSQLAFGALGVTLIYGTLRFSNYAGGETMAWGAMFTILFTWLFQSLGISIQPLPTALIALPFSILVTVFLILVIDQSVYKYYRVKRSEPSIVIIVSLGVAMMMNAATRIIIGPKDRNFFDGERFLIKARDFKNATGLSEGLSLKFSQIITVSSSVFFVIILFWFLYKTKTGNKNASRANFSDITDFIGWYTTQSEKLVGISKNDYYNQYLAYHEGQGGWKKESYLEKKWLIEVAKTVERNAKMYNNQLKECEDKLNKKGFFGIF